MKLYEIKSLNENSFPTDRFEIEKLLIDLKIENYTIHPNGVVDVDGDVDLNGLDLDKLPVQFGKVIFDFDCAGNKLVNLVGSPTEVGGSFQCSYNKLTSLEGCPTSVGRNFDCSNNQLINLVGCPTSVGRDFDCSNNQLINLVGCPTSVGRDFECYNNQLTNLVGCPKEVGLDFYCSNNKLTSLEGCPSSVDGSLICSNNQLTTLEGINDLIHKIGEKFICTSIIKIATGGLGLILIDGINHINISFAHKSAELIIRKYLGRPDDIFECQNELIEAGLEEYAKL